MVSSKNHGLDVERPAAPHRPADPALCGRFDEAAPSLQEPLLEGIKGSTLHVFEEGSHLPMWEQREEYMAVVDAFLAAND